MGGTHRPGSAVELNHIRPESSLSGLLHVRTSEIGEITDEERQRGLEHLLEIRALLHRSDEQTRLKRRILELQREIQRLSARLAVIEGDETSRRDDGPKHVQHQARDAQQQDERDDDARDR